MAPEEIHLPRPRSSPHLPRPGRCRRRRWWRWQRPTHQTVEGRGGGKYGGASELGGAAAGELGAAEEAGRRRDAGRRRLSGGGAAIWRRHVSDLGLEGLAVLLRTMQRCRVSSQGSQPAAESSSLQLTWAWPRWLSEAYLLRHRRATDGGVGACSSASKYKGGGSRNLLGPSLKICRMLVPISMGGLSCSGRPCQRNSLCE